MFSKFRKDEGKVDLCLIQTLNIKKGEIPINMLLGVQTIMLARHQINNSDIDGDNKGDKINISNATHDIIRAA